MPVYPGAPKLEPEPHNLADDHQDIIVDTGQQRRRCTQAAQYPAGDGVQLTDVTEGEAPAETNPGVDGA